MHGAVYRARADVRAVVHAHPVFSSVLAVRHEEIPPILDEQVVYVGGEVAVSDYAPSATEELAEATVAALGPRMAVLLANHGTLAVGSDPEHALEVTRFVRAAGPDLVLRRRPAGEPAIARRRGGRRTRYLSHATEGSRSINGAEGSGFSPATALREGQPSRHGRRVRAGPLQHAWIGIWPADCCRWVVNGVEVDLADCFFEVDGVRHGFAEVTPESPFSLAMNMDVNVGRARRHLARRPGHAAPGLRGAGAWGPVLRD